MENVSTGHYQETVETVERLAKVSFAGHVLTSDPAWPGLWRCRNPGTTFYSFNILFPPGAVVLYGDVGEIILRPNDYDSLGWLTRCINSRDYILSKIRPGTKTYYLGDGKAELEKAMEGKIHVGVSFDIYTMEQFHNSWYEVTDSDMPEISGHSAANLWNYEALGTFCRLYGEIQSEGKE